jgi:hypothetical protein
MIDRGIPSRPDPVDHHALLPEPNLVQTAALRQRAMVIPRTAYSLSAYGNVPQPEWSIRTPVIPSPKPAFPHTVPVLPADPASQTDKGKRPDHKRHAFSEPPKDAELGPKPRFFRGILGAFLAALLGAALWGVVGKLTGGWEFKYFAVVIGVLTGGAASFLAGRPTKIMGIVGGVFGLISILGGKALFELLVQPELSMADHIAYHTTVIDLIFYGVTVVVGFTVGTTGGLRTQARRLFRRFPVRLPFLRV